MVKQTTIVVIGSLRVNAKIIKLSLIIITISNLSDAFTVKLNSKQQHHSKRSSFWFHLWFDETKKKENRHFFCFKIITINSKENIHITYKSHRDTSNEFPQDIFVKENKQNFNNFG